MSKQNPKKKPTAKQAGVKTKTTKPETVSSTSSVLSTYGPIAILALTGLFVLILRLRLLAIPMERDEAGFAYIGHWLLNGKSLYIDVVDNKLPGLYFLYAMFTTLFGYQSTGVHIGLLLANITSCICFYFLIKELFNKYVALLATAFFALLMVSANVVGFAAHATQLLLPFILGAWVLFFKGVRSGKWWQFLIAGLLIGIAFSIKQQSVVFGMLAAVIWWPIRLVWHRKENGRLPFLEYLCLGVGGFLPITLIGGYFAMTNRFDQLLFWAYEQPTSMASTFNLSRWQLFSDIFPKIIKDFQFLWIAGLIGVVVAFIIPGKKMAAWFSVGFALLGLGSVVIGAAFYNHYFVLALPGVALLAAIALYFIHYKFGTAGTVISIVFASIGILIPMISQNDYFLRPDYAVIHQRAYHQMFPELEKIGQELRKRLPEGEKIGVMGSEPGVLVAADRFACTKHIFMYPLLSHPKLSPPLQIEYSEEMKACLPKFIVWNKSNGSWTGGYENLQLFRQMMQWIGENYTTTAIAEYRPGREGVIVWDAAVQTHQSQSDQQVYVFERK